MCDSMCDSHKNEKKSAKNSKGDEDVFKTATLKIPETRKTKIYNALKEVEMIRSGKLPRKSARDFLKESRNN